MEQQLNVLVQSSNYYAPFAGVMLTSLFENNREMDSIIVYLLTADMSEKNRECFLSLAEQYKRTVKFLDTARLDVFLEKNQAPKYKGSYAAYYKIFALSLIEDDIDRLVYLDSDLVVNGSLAYLINVNLDDSVLGMCVDSVLGAYPEMIGLNSACYYNTGVIVFDVKRWISEKWMDEIIHHIVSVHGSYPIVDQDILNLVLCGKIQTLPLIYNLNSGILWYRDYHFFIASHGLKEYYSESEFIQAQQSPIVLHCMATFGTRPWYETDHAAKEIWKKYLDISPWNNYKYQKNHITWTDKIQYFLFRNTPRCFFALIHRSCWHLSLYRQLKKLGVR